MTDPRLESVTPDQERAREALRQLPSPPASPDFRALLAQRFASGRIAEGAAARHRRPSADLPIWRRPVVLRWAGVPLAFATLLLVVGVLNRGPDWRLAAVTGLGVAVVDGRPVPLNHVEELAHGIRPGARVVIPQGATLEITSRGRLMLQVLGGTELRIPAPPARWFGRSVRAELARGEIRVATGSDFAGARLAIVTPEARVEVKGTTVAVICEPHGTCVCVLEGQVEVGAHAGPMNTVGPGKRRFVFSDGREPEVDEMREVEAVELERLRIRTAGMLAR